MSKLKERFGDINKEVFNKMNSLERQPIAKYNNMMRTIRKWESQIDTYKRDIEKLNELISNNLKLGLTIKDSNIPKDLSDSRKPENLLMGLGIDTTRKFFKSNKYLDPIKENILNNFSKSTLLKKITKRVANLGLS